MLVRDGRVGGSGLAEVANVFVVRVLVLKNMTFVCFLENSYKNSDLRVTRRDFVDTYLGFTVMVRNPQF